MKPTIQEIITTELVRLHELSKTTGLDMAGFKKLECIVRIYRDFVGVGSNPGNGKPNEGSPEEADVEELLEGLEHSLPKPV